MKSIVDIYKEIKNPEFLEGQFSEIHWNKNVLFINPQLNGRSFYKYILPYIVMFEYDRWGTALTSIDKYKPNKEYEFVSIPLNSKKILWADYIVVPFTNQDLTELYDTIRKINPNVKIIFNVDFNYYLISKKHPLHSTFGVEENHSIIEDNIFYSDITLCTNPRLSEYLIKKFKEDLKERYDDKFSDVGIGALPIFIDKDIIVENIEKESSENKVESKSLRVGIVATNYTWEDINSYKQLFSEIRTKLGDKITFVLIGFDGVDNITGKSCFPEGFEIEQVEPCTIIHYFKQLNNSNIDLLFIPLRDNEFNQTSENYNKFIEAGLFKIPVMVYNIFPYSEIINNGKNGIILNKKNEFVERLEFFSENRDELKRMGSEANQMILDSFTFNKTNLDILNSIYSK